MSSQMYAQTKIQPDIPWELRMALQNKKIDMCSRQLENKLQVLTKRM